jgi:hypothetical protein
VHLLQDSLLLSQKKLLQGQDQVVGLPAASNPQSVVSVMLRKVTRPSDVKWSLQKMSDPGQSKFMNAALNLCE